jgi:hypothetical protein
LLKSCGSGHREHNIGRKTQGAWRTAYTDFNLRDKELEYIFPEGSEAMVFDNDTCLVGYSELNPDYAVGIVTRIEKLQRNAKLDRSCAEGIFINMLRS